MRDWHKTLRCPMCGGAMWPKWEGTAIDRCGYPRIWMTVSFAAVCDGCGYTEEVRALNAQQEVPSA